MASRRARQTIAVLGRLGSDEASHLARGRLARGEREPRQSAERRRAQAFRQALEQLGPLYVKVGQLLSTRPDLMPAYMRAELSLLTDEVGALPFAAFEPVLEAELGGNWRSSFTSFETAHVLGTASLAQVYRARRSDGTACVVKIQRPGSRETVFGDMALLRSVVKSVARMTPRFSEVIDARAMMDVLFASMADELDFTREAANMKDGRKAARGYRTIKVPKVILATPSVLIQTLAKGQAASRMKPGDLSRKKRKRVSKELLAFIFKSYFIDRTFHADPHPGNVLVDADGTAHIIDWGMVGKIDRSTSAAMLEALLAMAYNDGASLARAWMRLGHTTPWSNIGGFTSDIARFVPRVTDASLEELNFGVAFSEVIAYSTRRGIQTAPAASIIGKSFANMEGTVRHISPGLKMADSIREVLREVLLATVKDLVSPEQLGQYTLQSAHAITHGPGLGMRLLADLTNRQVTVQSNTQLGHPVKPGTRMPSGLKTALGLGALAAWQHRR